MLQANQFYIDLDLHKKGCPFKPKIAKFKNFSRPNRHFPVLFKTDFIFSRIPPFLITFQAYANPNLLGNLFHPKTTFVL